MGVKVTLMVQLRNHPSELPHALVSLKSLTFAPVIAMLEIFSVVHPSFRRVMVCAAEAVPIAWLANVRELGLNRVEAVAA